MSTFKVTAFYDGDKPYELLIEADRIETASDAAQWMFASAALIVVEPVALTEI